MSGVLIIGGRSEIGTSAELYATPTDNKQTTWSPGHKRKQVRRLFPLRKNIYSTRMSYTSLTESDVSAVPTREDLCREYFFAGYSNQEMSAILSSKHQIVVSTRHLRRLLSTMGLKRRNGSNIRRAAAAIKVELDGSGQNLGYRSLQRRLLSKYGLVVSRALVSRIQKILDPEGVESRRIHRLKRRVYSNDGPNFLIHIDGYDKLKRYGFAIHGAVDGFSRKVLWLRVGRTNNKPEVVASYFVDYLEEIKGAPRCIRVDAGTENTLIEDIQTAFRLENGDEMAGSKSVIVGPSPSNQRVERYWRSSRESGGQFWMDMFKDLESEGHLDTGNPVHIECLRFCFTRIIQADLKNQMVDWNQHYIRQSNSVQSLPGKPDMLFYVPNLFGFVDYKSSISLADVASVRRRFCDIPRLVGCDPDTEHRCTSLMLTQSRRQPINHIEALELFVWLLPLL